MSAETRMPPPAARAARAAPAALLLGGLALWLLSFLWVEPERVWRALLIGFLYFTPLAGGLVTWLAIIRAADGGWASGREEAAAQGFTFFLPSLVILVLLWAASGSWAPWHGKTLPQGLWLDTTLVFARETAALLAFWAMAAWFLRRRDTAGGRRLAAILTLVFSLVFSLQGFDLVMALDPHWHSSLFGGYFFISSLYLALAAWGLLAALSPAGDKEFRRTIGNLLYAFAMLTAYLMFSQALPIWYENLPHETSFLADRLEPGPVRLLTWFLVAAAWLGPLVLLLPRKAREERWPLGLICGLILVAMWLERWWLVAPTFNSTLPGLSEIAVAAAMLGAWGAGAAFSTRQTDGKESGR